MTIDSESRPSIYVLAGTNGAGKSSVAGATFRELGSNYFDPDEATRRILDVDPGPGFGEANRRAWHQGKRLLQTAIATHVDFAFETTLGGDTILSLLETAHNAGLAVRVWYVGLQGVDIHIARVRARVAEGGHDIPETKIRERYDRSRANLIRLLPRLTELRLYDNSEDSNPALGIAPQPRLILHAVDGAVRETCEVSAVPEWAKPIFMAALRHYSV